MTRMGKSTLGLLVVASLFTAMVGQVANAAASDEIQLSDAVKALIEQEGLTVQAFDPQGNLWLVDRRGNQVVMTAEFLEHYGQATAVDTYSLCPCSSPARIWEIIKEAYTIFCICRDIIYYASQVQNGWGEHISDGWVCCDIINGKVYWR